MWLSAGIESPATRIWMSSSSLERLRELISIDLCVEALLSTENDLQSKFDRSDKNGIWHDVNWAQCLQQDSSYNEVACWKAACTP
jgi:hypothetical protein